MKIVTFTIPCYNSAAYMQRCIDSLLPCGEEVEIIIVDDGSTDNTAEIADCYAEKYPNIIKAIHQENGGHGEAVNTGLKNASGFYFKVVDSDDWVNKLGVKKMLQTLKSLISGTNAPDLMVCNYIYEKLHEGTSHIISYRNIFPCNQIFWWDDIRKFPFWKYLMMHSLIYKTQLLRKCDLKLPKHTFYVDNIFVYQPLPSVKTIYYLDVDLYHYFIGREDQSVNENVFIKKIDQQLLVMYLMTKCHSLPNGIPSKKLSSYMINHLVIMITISIVFLRLSDTKDSQKKERELWNHLKCHHKYLYRHAMSRLLRVVSTLPGKSGNIITVTIYRMVRKLYKCN